MFQQPTKEDFSEKSRSTKNSGLTQRKEKSDRYRDFSDSVVFFFSKSPEKL